jgi:Tfp pilus assembly protein FimT
MGEGEKKSRKKNVILIAAVVIFLIILWIAVPNLSKLLEPEKEENKEEEIYKQYDKIQGQDTVFFQNTELNVSITREYDDYWDFTTFKANWTDIWGNSSTLKANTPGNLLDDIITKAEGLSTNQLKWFEFMLNKVVK